MPSEATRAYIYRIVLALSVVALVYGVVTQEQVDAWLQVIGAVVGVVTGGLATANTSTK